MLASGTQDRGFDPGRKNPQHAFHRMGSKAACPMSQLCGRLKEPSNYVEFGLSGEIWSAISRSNFIFRLEVWHGASLGMNGGTKNEGLEYKRPQILKCDKRNFRHPYKNNSLPLTHISAQNFATTTKIHLP
jgi:hypothetical protein